MNRKPANTDASIAKRAALCDEQAQRAEMRRLRALDVGNQIEADGATRTIEEAVSCAARLRAQVGQ